MVPGSIDPHVSEEMARLGIEPAAIIPLDETVNDFDMAMKPLLDLSEGSATNAVDTLLAELLRDKVQAIKTN